jgi:transcriptional regulator with XRE-family HTH domain
MQLMGKSDSPLRNALAQTLRELRAERGLSQEELADAAGLHRTFVGAVERSERNISLDNIGKLAAALGVPASILLGKLPK